MIGRKGSPSAMEEDKLKGFDDFELKLGDMMRGERATLSKSLLDVQRELRIKAAYIAAIESGDLAAFDTQSFLPGYVRSYARYLGLDPDWAFERFCIETGYHSAHAGLVPAARTPRAAVTGAPAPAGATNMGNALTNPTTPFIPRPEGFWSKIELRAVGSVLVLAALVGGIGYAGWSVLKEVQRVQLSPVDQAPGVSADLDPVAVPAHETVQTAAADTLPDTPSVDTAGRIYRPQSLDAPVMVSRDSPIASIDPAQTGLLAGQSPDPAAPAPAGTTQLAAATPADGTAAPVLRTSGTAAAPELEILAVRPSWVRIKSADGSTLLEKVMDAGERYTVPKMAEPPVLRTGESGAVYFAVNGVAHGPVGKRGEVAKNIVLSPESINEKFAVANVSADGDLAKMVAVADASAVTQPANGASGD